MKKYIYSNEYETYEIYKFGNRWVIYQDGVDADRHYKTLKEAKQAIDNQDVWF